MSQTYRRALAWFARHPTVFVVAVAFTAVVAVGVVGDLAGSAEFVTPAEMGTGEVGTEDMTSGDGGPNEFEDN